MPSTVPSPAELRRVAVEAATACAPRLVRAFRSTPAEIDLGTKRNTHDLVTVHDRATEDELVRLLGRAVPGSRFTGEEGGARGADAAVEWIIDPIDGTANFAHGFAMFSVSVAAAVEGEVVAGVVLDPVNGLEFSADDAGAYLNGERFGAGPSDGSGTDGAPDVAGGAGSAPAPAPEHALNLVTSYPSAEALAVDGPAALERFGRLVDAYATVRRTVSGALELAYTAIGWADVTLGVDTNPWDVAVGQLLVRRAGGRYVARSYAAGADGGRGAHLAPCYVAVAPGRAAPTALGVLEETVAARRAAGHRRAGRETSPTLAG
ncbi:inositol monophosphatase [Citricoccus sp. SGAir0253]|uniref:inositol monophosphatase family protein n=1 Tax=Citricoccus sp. SGAir0253 TaxID=2567881 RepID=UPI0010CD24E1|nr:inositol monophosphatase family protein [Citricoccus sp. SGAir0253]QCU78750.1 inositol monophosphatase [Citricoccus sp. SGAir0253]